MSEPQPAPSGSFVATVVVAISIIFGQLLSFCLQVLLALLTAPLLCWQDGRYRFQYFQSCTFRSIISITQFCLNPCWRTRFIRFDEHSGPPKGGIGSIIFCNHRSNADAWFVSSVQLCAGFEARYVYKSMLGKAPIAGCTIKLAGDLPAHFGDKEKIKDLLECSKQVLLKGSNIIVFAEGTRSPSGLLQNFKPSFFRVCAELGCPAVPLCLLGNERAWPHGQWKVGCATVTALLGKPIMPGGLSAEGLSNEVRAAMQVMAESALKKGFIDNDDPMITDRPYPWWKPLEEFGEMNEEEQLELLRSGKMHERGKHWS